jgi:hypothetical protein
MNYVMRFIFPTLTLLLLSLTLQAHETKEDIIARAESAAPSQVSKHATIYDMDGHTVLREGTNGWHCMPNVHLIPGDKHPMCNDAVWMKWMRAIAKGEEFSTDRIGLGYMLQGDAFVSNSDPGATDPKNGEQWVEEGPHLMVIVPKELLKGVSTDPHNGGPYVMWADTPYAHIMFPTENKTLAQMNQGRAE